MIEEEKVEEEIKEIPKRNMHNSNHPHHSEPKNHGKYDYVLIPDNSQ